MDSRLLARSTQVSKAVLRRRFGVLWAARRRLSREAAAEVRGAAAAEVVFEVVMRLWDGDAG